MGSKKGENIIKSEHINPFIQGTIETFKNVADVDIKITNTTVTNEEVKSKGSIILIGVVGELSGAMLANITLETKNKVLTAMFGGMDAEEQSNEMLNSALGELFNITMGTVATKLEGIGVNIDISPPNVINGSGASVTVSKTPSIVLSLEGDGIDMDLYLSIK